MRRIGIMLFVMMFFAVASTGQSQLRIGNAAKLEPVAETKLVMRGLIEPNFAGLGAKLKDKPENAETWAFARGQSLLVAEGANLLMMRPPKTRAAQDAWMARAVELRDAGVKLATAAAAKDYVNARAGVATIANVCNRCHEAFAVKQKIEPFNN